MTWVNRLDSFLLSQQGKIVGRYGESLICNTVDACYTARPNCSQEEIDITFRFHGNYKQQPYNVWLDEVTLNPY